jgi:hypothetical protein
MLPAPLITVVVATFVASDQTPRLPVTLRISVPRRADSAQPQGPDAIGPRDLEESPNRWSELTVATPASLS